MLGAANFKAGPLMAFSSGNLCYQIEHHLFPDLPSNRYAEIAERVRPLCEKYGLPYTTGSLGHQYLQTLRTINRLALPNRFLAPLPAAAPEPDPESVLEVDDGPRMDRATVRRHRRLGKGRRRGAQRREALKGLQLESDSRTHTAPRPAA